MCADVCVREKHRHCDGQIHPNDEEEAAGYTQIANLIEKWQVGTFSRDVRDLLMHQ